MIIGTAGHIDHGKTALVKTLTGIDADRLVEEKKRGITIDLGYAYHPLPDGNIAGFVDVPGHERFIHNMLAGATGIDLMLLVVAADDGVMPQTREHLQIVDLLGIENGIVALTKADLAGDDLRAQRIAEIQTLLAPTRFAGAPILPVSSLTGEGMEELTSLIANYGASSRPHSGYPRLAIDRCFNLHGTGLVVTGTLFAGTVAVDDRLIVSPQGIDVRLRGLHAQNRPVEHAFAGQRCALNLSGARLEKSKIQRGNWVLAEEIHEPSSVIDIRMRLLANEEKPLNHWTPVHVHIAAAHVMGRIALLEADRLAPGEEAYAQIVLDEPIGVLARDHIILRDQSAQRTIGGAVTVDPFATQRHRRKPERLARLRALSFAPREAASKLISEPPGFFDRTIFSRSFNLTRQEANDLWNSLGAVAAGGFIFGRDAWIGARQNAIQTLAGYHESVPGMPGLQPERLRHLMILRLPKDGFREIIDAEIGIGGIVADGPWLRLPHHKITLNAEDEELWRSIECVLRQNRFRPPRVRDFANDLEVDEERTRQLMRKLVRMGQLVEIAKDHFFLRSTVAELIQIAADIAQHHSAHFVTAAEFRNRIESGRKVAIQILEFMDRQGITIRRGDLRRVREDRLSHFGDAA